MASFAITMKSTYDPKEKSRRLAIVYSLILSWPEPHARKTGADSDHSGCESTSETADESEETDDKS